jgi:hypothetical protein
VSYSSPSCEVVELDTGFRMAVVWANFIDVVSKPL